ncbi:hypothetical protein GALMADRAFT_223808 [Galerina marginata CBS 339.88]|uniref:CCHC-type domain-containing protein n=1 Tax=Galerina marginata (strain CBS 339.88) TaxID=685588 RepID=A0A067T5N0_GALM3|nr:hypothetical protein GALMADRAFT_223808 [Galerina marginata CBS 339.88]
MSGNQPIEGQTSPYLQNEDENSHFQNVSPEAMVRVTSEMCVQLEKECRRREKRNEERKQRRDSGEQTVSEDEEDVILSVLKGKGKENPTEGTSNVGTSTLASDFTPTMELGIASTPSKVKGGLIFADSDAEGREFSMHDDSIPESIAMLAKCHRTPPLSLFLGESLDRIKSARDIKYIKVGTGEFANMKLLDVSSFPADISLDNSQWTRAYNTFLDFIASSMGERLYTGFLNHWGTMMKDQNFLQWFKAYKTFDEKVRQRFFTAPFIIDPTSVQYNTALQEAKLCISVAPRMSQPGRRAPATNRYPSTGNRWQPYANTSQQSFRSYAKMRCLRCGNEGHRAEGCKSETPSKTGRSFVVRAAGRGLERLSDGRPVCIRFNIGTCSISDPSHPMHICSLCADAHHGATACTRN